MILLAFKRNEVVGVFFWGQVTLDYATTCLYPFCDRRATEAIHLAYLFKRFSLELCLVGILKLLLTVSLTFFFFFAQGNKPKHSLWDDSAVFVLPLKASGIGG